MSEYRESTNWKKLGLSTRRARALIIDKIVAEPHPRMLGLAWGDCPLADIAPRHIREIRDANLIWDPVVDPETGEDTGDVAMTNKEGSNGWLKTLRAAYAWAFNDRKMNLPSDPTLGIKLYPGSKEGFHCWSVGEIEAYRAKHPIGSKARLALEVLLFTGQRRGDAVRLGAGLMSTDTHGRPMFIFEQQKNGGTERATVAHVPLFPWLREIVQATPCAGSEFILCQDDGSPYTKESFGNMFRGWCNEAGLHECSAHGLRKAFVVEMIRRKRRPQEIMGVTGHTTMKEFDRYARAYMRQNAVEQMLDDFEAEHANAA
jgi:integrase